jgi:hypothetical protein
VRTGLRRRGGAGRRVDHSADGLARPFGDERRLPGFGRRTHRGLDLHPQPVDDGEQRAVLLPGRRVDGRIDEQQPAQPHAPFEKARQVLVHPGPGRVDRTCARGHVGNAAHRLGGVFQDIGEGGAGRRSVRLDLLVVR